MGHLHRYLQQESCLFAESCDDLGRLRARTVVAGAPTMSASPFGNALTLDGVADYVTLAAQEYPLRFDAGTQDFSVAAWVLTSTTALQIILDKRDADDDGWVLFLDANAFPAFSLDGIDIVGATAVSDGEWHHVAAVIDRSGNGQMYLDGATDGAAVAIGGEVMATTTAPRIGAVSYAAASYFNGQMRNPMVFNRILTLAEITGLAGLRAFDY